MLTTSAVELALVQRIVARVADATTENAYLAATSIAKTAQMFRGVSATKVLGGAKMMG